MRYKELDGQTVAHGRVLTINGTKNGGYRECMVSFLHGAQEQSPGSGSKRRRVLVVGRRIAANKGANDEVLRFFDYWRTIAFGRKKREKEKREW